MVDYKKIATEARIKVLELIYSAQTSHIGSNFSCIDILTVLFENVDPQKDEVILSAGWKAAAWYYFLWRKGIITENELNSFCQPNSPFIGLVEPINRWGLKCAGGSMGIAFSMGIGMARARKALKKDGFIYILISDGEMQCGNVWESARKAVQEKLDNIIVIVDKNGFCAMGKTKDILNIEKDDLFNGWISFEINGHDYLEIRDCINNMNDFIGKPKVIIANTIKGFPISFMSGNNDWHYRHIDDDSYQKALYELDK